MLAAIVWREAEQVGSPGGIRMERWTGKAEPLWRPRAQRAAADPTGRAHSGFLPLGPGSRLSTGLSPLTQRLEASQNTQAPVTGSQG